MDKTQLVLATAMSLAFGTTSAQAVTFIFGNSTTDGVQGVDFNFTCNTSNFTAGDEFRMCTPSGDLGGGPPLQKDAINGTESWSFDATGVMTAVNNTATTTGLSADAISKIDMGVLPESGSRTGDSSIDQGAFFKGQLFAFLAPTFGSSAGNLYGKGQYTETGATTFEVFFPVLEAQWAGAFM